MKISIIVPVYNVEKELSRCIESIINQTYQNIEIILVDDGSLDKSGKICDEYARNDSRICVIHKENGGLSDARNAGIEIAQGEYFLLVDSDDCIELDTCQRFINVIGEDIPDIVVGDYIELRNNVKILHIHKKIKPERVYTGETYVLDALNNNEIHLEACLNLYRKDFWKENLFLFKKGILHEDMQLIPKVFLAAEKIKYMNMPFYHYIIREGSIMNQNNKEKRYKDSMDIYSEWKEFIVKIENKEIKYLFNCFLGKCFIRTCTVLNVKKPDYRIVSRIHLLKYSRSMKEFVRAILFIIIPNIYFKIYCLISQN